MDLSACRWQALALVRGGAYHSRSTFLSILSIFLPNKTIFIKIKHIIDLIVTFHYA